MATTNSWWICRRTRSLLSRRGRATTLGSHRSKLRSAIRIALTVAIYATGGSAQTISQADTRALRTNPPILIAHYGPDPLQVAELRLPSGPGPFPVVMVLHGGCLQAGMDTLRGTAPLATAIANMGYASWNVEYRALGDTGGGWPGTYQDWANALDYLRVIAKAWPIQMANVVTVGHSLGGTGAIWLATRSRLPAPSEVRGRNPLPVRGVVDIDGPPDLQPFIGLDERTCGRPIVMPLMGGTAAQQPQRYAQVTPSNLGVARVPQLLIPSVLLPQAMAENYKAKVDPSEEMVQIVSVEDGGHFDVIAPGSLTWRSYVGPALEMFLKRMTR